MTDSDDEWLAYRVEHGDFRQTDLSPLSLEVIEAALAPLSEEGYGDEPYPVLIAWGMPHLARALRINIDLVLRGKTPLGTPEVFDAENWV